MTVAAGAGDFRYPLYEVSGSPRELGQQHGELARLRILGYLGYLSETLKMDERTLARRATLFRGEFQRHCPELLEEIDGVAEGAGLNSGLALASQMRGELACLSDGACTTFAIGPRATAGGRILIGQTSDMPEEIRSFAYVLRIRPDNRPAAIMWTFGGMIGYHGLNEHGVSHYANSLGGGPGWRFAPSHYPLKRLILEQKSLADVLQTMRRFPVCSNGNYMLCDGGNRLLDVELTSEGPHLIEDTAAGFLVHTNHFLSTEHSGPENLEQSLPDSLPRLERMRTLIQEKLGSITVADMQRILADHDGAPVSICRHPHHGYGDQVLPASGCTVAAIIAEPDRGIFHVAAGNPCETSFLPFRL